ncbi:MAG: NAD-dependent malic enzyme [Deltaproteobacteria bacterium RIFOXYD12_FULL_57_12]|nr:MAG: NAD-dependent malic enzyme [Deltaproteobacteria bacterium RIFOXYD12_FULL_57_12]
MPEGSYEFGYDDCGNTREIRVSVRGLAVLNNNFTNKGTSFSEEERRQLKLSGLVPPAIRPLESQVENSLAVFGGKQDALEKFIYVRSLFDRNVTLAHALISRDIGQFMPIIYTPTVGLACQQYSSMFRRANGLHLYPDNIEQAEEILLQYGHRDIRVAVVTDNQGILGIGDQGAGGIAICLGKLMLYTQGAGIAPWHCLPISLDVGTDNQALLADPDYLGWRQPRLTGEAYVRFVQRFARAFRTVYPNALCQWEDFSKQNAFAIRDAYLHDLISFNDDIQGTGAVVLAGILSAMRIKQEKLVDQVFLVHGAGAGGVGVAEQLDTALREAGLSAAEARARIFTVDRKGLVTTDRPLEPYKMKFAKEPALLPWWQGPSDGGLLNVLRHVKVTVLIGTSGQAGAFNEEVVRAMLANCEQPVILPLSNPTAKAEALPADLYRWSGGRALIATGSPFAPVNREGRTIRVGQGNNVFVFPGVGLGVLASGAREVLPEFFTAAARAVAENVAPADLRDGILFPPVHNLRAISRAVALAVGRAAIAKGVSGLCVYSRFQHDNDPERLAELINSMFWEPVYLPLVAV